MLPDIDGHAPGRVDECPTHNDEYNDSCWGWSSGPQAFARRATQHGFPSSAVGFSLRTPRGYLLFLGRGCLEGFLGKTKNPLSI